MYTSIVAAIPGLRALRLIYPVRGEKRGVATQRSESGRLIPYAMSALKAASRRRANWPRPVLQRRSGTVGGITQGPSVNRRFLAPAVLPTLKLSSPF